MNNLAMMQRAKSKAHWPVGVLCAMLFAISEELFGGRVC